MTTKRKITIWMQNGTGEGVMAAKLAVDTGNEYEFKNISNESSWRELREVVPNATKVPQIFVGEKHVGGLKELIAELGVDVTKL
jgi:glutaredoxin